MRYTIFAAPSARNERFVSEGREGMSLAGAMVGKVATCSYECGSWLHHLD